MNLQLFAEDPPADTPPEEPPADNPPGDDNPPTVEELMTQLAQERAINAKNKVALDKALKDNGNLTKQLRTRMTAEEQQQEAEQEAQRAKDKEFNDMKTQLRVMNFSKRFMGMGMDEKTAESIATLTPTMENEEEFFNILGNFIKDSNQKAAESHMQEFLKNRPDIKAGKGGDGESLAVQIAKGLAETARNTVDTEALKRFM